MTYTRVAGIWPRADLASAVTASAGSLTILQDVGWPTDSGEVFAVQIDSEILLLIGAPTGLTYSVPIIDGVLCRGMEGSTAADHVAYAAIVAPQTPGTVSELISQAILEEDTGPLEDLERRFQTLAGSLFLAGVPHTPDLEDDVEAGLEYDPDVSESVVTESGLEPYKGGQVRLVTITTDAILSSDSRKLVSYSNAAAVAVSLRGNYGDRFLVDVENRGAGTVTLTPLFGTIDGSSTLALTTNQGVRIFSDGTNYYTQRGIGGSGGTWGSITGTLADQADLQAELDAKVTSGGALGTPSSGTLANCTGLPVAGGGTGRASHTAYAVLCGGTTPTAAQQSIGSVGTFGQTLVSSGAGALPTFAGGLTLLSSATASSSATVNFTLTDWTSSDFAAYLIVWSHVAPVTDAVNMYIRTSTDGGSSYDAGASDYAFSGWRVNHTGTASESDDAADFIKVANSLGNASNETCSGSLLILNPSAAKFGSLTYQSGFVDSAGNKNSQQGIGFRLSAANVDAIRFLMSSGNIASGNFALYGIGWEAP